MKELVLRAARAGGFNMLARAVTRGELRILCYHGLWTTPGMAYGDRLFIAPEQFEARMTWLKRSGYPILPLDEAVRRLGDETLPRRAVVVTIDDGWSSTYSHMLPILERLGIPATIYVTTWYVDHQIPIIGKSIDYILARAGVAYRPPAEVARLAAEIDALPLTEREAALRAFAARHGISTEPWWSGRQFHLMTAAECADASRRGFDIQLHTHRHIHMETHIDELACDLEINRDRLADVCAAPPARFYHFCYPSGSYHPGAEPILAAAGVKSATLVDQGLNAPGTNPLRLRRFLDGRSVSQPEFEAYLAGMLELVDLGRSRLPARLRR